MEFFDLKTQYHRYKNEIDSAINAVLKSSQYIMGQEIRSLEIELEKYLGVKYCLGVSSGTDGLLLALTALEVGVGDEVISVPYTWVSPVECIKRLGAKPVLVDIDPETYLMDVDQLEKAITPKTKAIIPVSLYGQMPNFEKIMEIARAHNIAVIEDGAQSFGAKQKGRRSGTLATIGVTSFFPTKPLGCYGDGGAVFTNDEELAAKMFAMRVHGAPERYNHQYIGLNARLDTLQAAILLAKLPFFEEELEKRHLIGEYYNENLKEFFVTPKIMDGNTHTYAQYVLLSPQRNKIMEHLKNEGVPSGVYYPICIHEQPAYQDMGYVKGDFPNAEKVAREVFSIPMHPFLTSEDQYQIVEALTASILQKI